MVLALISEIQDSVRSCEESDIVPPTKTAILCKSAQKLPEIWMNLP
jgi:hypothetical protein